MKAYSGALEVEDGDFILNADRLIVRDGAVAFMFSGSDEWGDFRIEGVAKQTERGPFIASNLWLVYPKYTSKDVATIQFEELNQTAQELRCRVKGTWKQYEDTWTFSGNLGPYKPT